MGAGFSLILGLSCVCGGAAGQVEPPPSYLCQPAYKIDNLCRLPTEAYLPQPGDVLLATDDNKFWAITHAIAFAFEPHNSGRCDALPHPAAIAAPERIRRQGAGLDPQTEDAAHGRAERVLDRFC